MTSQAIETVSKSDFIRRKADSKVTYIKLGYCRFNKAYECQDWSDINKFIYIKKGKLVFTDFDF